MLQVCDLCDQLQVAGFNITLSTLQFDDAWVKQMLRFYFEYNDDKPHYDLTTEASNNLPFIEGDYTFKVKKCCL